MTALSFLRLFRKEELPRRIRRTDPNAVGILDSTCEINGDPFNGWKLPVPPPDQRRLELGTRPCNPQPQSRFFQLPLEVRELIYKELMGGRRVHIDYVHKRPSPFRPQSISNKKRPNNHWQWWHVVCQRCDSFIEDRDHDRCPSYMCEYQDACDLGWRAAPEGTKIGGVEWLQCCQMRSVILRDNPARDTMHHAPSRARKLTASSYQEAVPILYGTNVFVTGEALDTPFHMSRVLLPDYGSRIRAMDILIRIGKPNCEPPELTGAWATVYPALFALFDQAFCNVRQLRVTMHMKPWDIPPVTMNEESMKKFLAPLDALAKSREWIRLELSVQGDWYSTLEGWAKAQDTWTLTQTEWTPQIPFNCGI
ncbi:uncharacterized protein N7459_004279 [Penicillium hispanicum]|uniref:uncharacterized protein n=1 Tax=Penicillium hispanicum TaxID=1080232 RepID=UPI00253FAEF0|nr:uncharacterized protein N7459_004279 [Penicillium hispanicum]KAJ5584479.1 hypothetical protein N7459_004279 [Penicillium hispanicum]